MVSELQCLLAFKDRMSMRRAASPTHGGVHICHVHGDDTRRYEKDTGGM
jgi:hypothetical protein